MKAGERVFLEKAIRVSSDKKIVIVKFSYAF